ncbi:MAG: hypothetical protein GX613_07110, partial [Chloroflexi bacterium]|nr:hypothetical protein [Chloroflexota bacterium]
FGSLITLTSPIGLLIAGPVTDLVGIQVWYVTAGALCLFAGVAAFFTPSVMNIEEHGAAAKSTSIEPPVASVQTGPAAR